ncbi:hypothetical protein [Serratia sp. Je.1.23.a]|uniref:hypothetical protein n=1 Tax=Serratia sp. Je.1.23.a TaxID=3142841 RepID=UPI003DA8C331
METADYLYDVLIPAASEFNKMLTARRRRFMAIRNGKSCRAKFFSKAAEKDWVRLCAERGLKNDTKLEY